MLKTPRILILGGGGTLGHKLWQVLPTRFPHTFASIRKKRDFYAKCGLFAGPNVIDGLDLRDFARVNAVLDEIKPSVIVNCAGVTLRSKEAQDKNSAISINALLPHRLAEWCSRSGARLIHFSTVCVYDGKKGGYTEEDPPDARDLYGMTKILGDVTAPFALTLRSSFIGREIFGGAELLEWFLAQEGKTVKGFRKALFTGLTTNKLAELVGDLIENHPGLNGLYHVSSETVSKYELLKLMKDAYNLDVQIVPEEGFEMKRDLDGNRFAKATGFVCPPWSRLMAEMAADKTPYAEWR
ncbi:MAG: NAD(P)-dependent oxidoreductase [Elusimicrobia bacterium HGW-Elusimicrobia-3]|jgi:dTDP-4-dehydrorhamnose reductase|nr:MAG: NAD(P)-dependent oxidoreductase [Elusimicrobia bacterium HGW-Elusimicrobia-3]